MSVFQIVAISILGAGTLVAIGFTIAFVVVSLKKEGKRESKAKVEKAIVEEVSEIDLDAMLAKLEEVSARKQEPVKKQEPIVEHVVVKQAPVIEEPVVEPVEEIVFEEEVEEDFEEPVEEVVAPKVVEVKEVSVKPAKVTVINKVEEQKGPEFDYRVRLEKIKESQAKIDRDLDKTTRAILKYERTIRRKERNQKMLDRRALELTNLNLLMYSVTDIKNVDAEKKTRQEELTKHISELKASIQDAENYLDSNKEKHENNIKLSDYLTHEKTRYADEVKELERAIASGKYFDDKDGFNN